MTVGFIGGGNMASAIIRGIRQSEQLRELALGLYDINSEKAAALAKECGMTHCGRIEELAEQSRYLVLAVKPQNFPEVLPQIKGHLAADTIVVSIAAGITADYIRSVLGENTRVVTVMPNTPLLLGCGATALSTDRQTPQDDFTFVCDLFHASGEVAVIPADKMNEIISVNGSSPAFIYLFAQGFVEYAQSVGIDGEVALRLFAKSLEGSAKMLTDSGRTIDELIQMVSSPGGTTLQGLEALRANGLPQAVQAACEACTKRAYELSGQS